MDCGDCTFVNNRLFLVCFIFTVRFVLFLFLFCLFFNPWNQRPYDPTTKLTLHSFTCQTYSVSYRKFRSWSEIRLELRNGNRVYVFRKLEKHNLTLWLSRDEEKLTEKSDAHGTCRVVVLLIKRIVLLHHVSVPSPPTQQRHFKKSEFALFQLHRYYTISKLNFEKCRWIFLNLQYSNQGQEKIEKKIIRQLFFYVLHEN